MPAAQHSVLGASAAHRWMTCPGSVAMSKGLPNDSTEFARRGSCAHAVLEECLRNKMQPEEFIGQTIKEYSEIEIDQEMSDSVQVGIDAVNAYIEKYEAETGLADWELTVEQRFDLSHIHPDMFGTCDLTLYFPAWKKLVVGDYKHGYIYVDAQRNKQCMQYAVGAAWIMHNREIDDIEILIIQPNSYGEPVKTWNCHPFELDMFKERLKEAAYKTEDPAAELVAGNHCKFCPASAKDGVCPALKTIIEDLALMKMTDETPLPRAPELMTKEQLQKAWKNANVLEGWIKAVKSYAHNQAIQGNIVEGAKLAEGRSNRKWKSVAAAKQALLNMLNLGLIEGEIEVSELKSPAQMEAQMKKNKGLIEHLWFKPPGKLSLVPIEDNRPSARTDAAAEFSEE